MSNFKDNSGLETIKPKTSKEERDRMMKEFLDKGGKVQKLKPGYPTNVGSLDKSKKPAFTKDDIEKGVSQSRSMEVFPILVGYHHPRHSHGTNLFYMYYNLV